MRPTASPARTPAAAWITMGSFWLPMMLGQIMIMGLGITLPAMMVDLGFGPAQAGTLGAIGWLLTAVFSVPLNAWITRYPPKPVIALGILGTALIYFVSAAASSYPVLLAARGAGVLMVMCSGAVIVLMQDQWFRPAQMATVKGLENSIAAIGQLLALVAMPLLMAAFSGWRGAYVIVGAAVLVGALGWLFLGRENRTPEYLARAASQKQSGSPMVTALKRKEILLLGIGTGGTTIGFVAFNTFWPTFAVTVRGLSLETAGGVLGIVAIGGIIASLIGGIISDRIGLRKPLLLAGGLLYPVGLFALLTLDSPLALSVGALFLGLVAYSYVSVLFAIPFELPGIRPQEIAVSIGVIVAIINLGGALGAQVAGILIEAMGLQTALTILSFTPLLLVACAALLPETGWRAKSEG